MDKQAARERLEAAEREIAECKRILSEPDEPLNPVFIPGHRESYYITQHWKGGFQADNREAWESVDKPVFRTRKAAQSYAEAFQVMLELRACDGACPFEGNKPMHIICRSCITGELSIDYWSQSFPHEFMTLSGCFKTQEQAQAAIDKVGADRIIKAVKTLTWSV